MVPYVKSYASKKDIYADVEKAFKKGYWPAHIEAGSMVWMCGRHWVHGPKYVGSVFRALKGAFMYSGCAMPCPEIKEEDMWLF